jgi:CRISPR/Cas system CMR-associated protein Cmr5 small subunit
MNKRLIERMIPAALEALEDAEIQGGAGAVAADGKAPKEFTGYVANFGTSAVQAGIRQTVHFYSAKSDRAEQRLKLSPVLWKVLCENSKVYKDSGKKSLKDYVDGLEQNWLELLRFRSDALAAAAAVKLALRSFKREETPEDQEGGR